MGTTSDGKDPQTIIERCLAADDCTAAFRHLREATAKRTLDQADQEAFLYRIALQTENEAVRDAAISRYEDAICRYGNSEQHMEKLGTLYLASGDKDSAWYIYCRIMGLEAVDGETRWFARYTLADLMLDKGRARKALALLLPAVKALSPNDCNAAPVFALMGKVHLALKSPETACRWYEKAMALDPNESGWPKELASGLERLKKSRSALKYWDRIIAMDPMKMSQTVCDGDRPIFKIQEFMKNVSNAKAHRRVISGEEG